MGISVKSECSMLNSERGDIAGLPPVLWLGMWTASLKRCSIFLDSSLCGLLFVWCVN